MICDRLYKVEKENAFVFQELYPEDLTAAITDDRIAFGAVLGQVPVALVIASVEPDSFYLEWLYVDKDFRNRGIGSEILTQFFDTIAGVSSDDSLYVTCEDEHLRDYLETMGFTFLGRNDAVCFVSEINKLIELPEIKKSNNVRFLSRMSQQQLNALNNQLFYETRAAVPVELPINPAEYMDESVAYMDDNSLKALLLLKNDSNGVNVAYVYDSTKTKKPLVECISTAKQLLLTDYDDDLKISATAINAQSESMAMKIFSSAEKKHYYTGSLSLYGYGDIIGE